MAKKKITKKRFFEILNETGYDDLERVLTTLERHDWLEAERYSKEKIESVSEYYEKRAHKMHELLESEGVYEL